ncbi:MAG: transcription termination factor Rho, partial [Coriobacteriales bacterium]|nr:transcription termination factor Rho [Coriobacteriales bacterium]
MIQKPSSDTGLIEAPSRILDGGVEIPAPAPRRRGRPRKNPLPEVPAKSGGDIPVDGGDITVEVEIAAPVPRRRGRPRKNPLPGETPKEAGKTSANARDATNARDGADASASSDSSDTLSALRASIPTPALDAPSASAPTPAPTPAFTPSASSRSDNSSASRSGYGGSGGGGRSGGKSNKSNNSGSNASGGKGKNNYQSYGRRPRRGYNGNSREQIVPQASREELESLKMAELREKAAELELDISDIKKKDVLIEAVLEAMVKAEGFVACEGVLDLLPEGYGFLRTSGYLPGEADIYVGMSMVRRNGLRKGDSVTGQVRPARDNEKYAALHRIDSVNGLALDDSRGRRRFADLTPVYPDERLLMEHGPNTITARTIDLVAPIGKGQRGLIVSPPKAGKTTILKDIAAAISANNPDVHLMCLLVDERPEEVTDMERSIKGEVVSSTFDMPSENHIAVAELVIERAKRLVEVGRDVVILLDSITRLARAYNLAQPASGRILSGGVDSTALYPPKRFLGAARNIEDGGSLTILASALIETGSKMDEVIFEEFKGTGNMELRLDRDLADRRIFPAIDPIASGTRKEDLLLDAQEAPLIWAVRRILANMNNTERAM